ncbi:cell adhesion molecule 3-like [Sardina pilchardus]|uniref:cell adhesion molecule 3-like n=1 Tax=Sardina pilchardus TaxID=27697 RepID=UPI002E12E521
MMGYITLSGGLFLTAQLLALLVMTEAGQNCTGKEPLIVPPALVVKYGDPATATCRVPYNAMMGWETPEGAKQEDNVRQLVWSVDRVTDWSLNGTISCYAVSDHGQCQTCLPIRMYKAPDNVILSFINHTGPLLEGKNYSLQCEVQSVAPVKNLTVIWFRGGDELQRSGCPEFTIEGDQSQNVTVSTNLSITASRKDHNTSYSCAAQLDLNTAEPVPVTRSDNILLEVLYKPAVESSMEDVSLTEGDRLELNCTADANPTSAFEWKHDNKTLGNNNSTLVLESVEMDSAGVYECVASNDQGQVSVTMTLTIRRNYLPWIVAVLVVVALVLLAVFFGSYCTYHKKNKTGAYILAKFKGGNSQNGQVAHTNGNTV